MTRSEKLITGLIIGAVAGAAAAYFFDTPKGKSFLDDFKNRVVDGMASRLGDVESSIREKFLAVTSTDEDDAGI